LGEIYAKRQDRKALEVVANDIFKLSGGEGPDWARVCDLGRDIDPTNPAYQPGGRPAAGSHAAALSSAPSTDPAPLSTDLDLDLDLDFDLPGDALTDAPAALPPAPSAPP